jgi:hypothetical protein
VARSTVEAGMMEPIDDTVDHVRGGAAGHLIVEYAASLMQEITVS